MSASTGRVRGWGAGCWRRRSTRSPRRSTAAPCSGCWRSEEHTSELQSLMRISYAVFCLKKKTKQLHERQNYYTLTIHQLTTDTLHQSRTTTATTHLQRH